MHAKTTTDSSRRTARRPTLVKNAKSSHFTAVDLDEREVLADLGEGTYPHTAHFHPAHDVAYLLYIASGHLEVVDLDQLETIQRIEDVGTTPVGSTLAAGGGFFFVGTAVDLPNHETAGVVAFRVRADGTVEHAGETPVGRCSGMRTDSDGRLLVGLKRAGELAILDADSDLDVQTCIDVGENPHDMYVLPDDDLVAINNAETTCATFVDTTSDEVRCRATVGENPHGFALAEADDYRYGLFPARDAEYVSLVDIDAARQGADNPTAGQIDIGAATGFATTTPNGRYALLDSYDDEFVTVVDLETRAVETRVSVGGEPLHIVPAPDGSECYVGNMASTELAVLDMEPLADGRPEDVTVIHRISGFGEQPSGIFQPTTDQ